MDSNRQTFLFKSPHKLFRQNCRKQVWDRHPASGEIIGVRTRALVAEFGIAGAEQPFTNPETGETTMIADIRGGFFDSRSAQDQLGWSDEEHDAVVAVLKFQAAKNPGMLQEVLPVHIPAPLPWATYELTDATEAVDLAVRLHLVPESLRYERENLRRAAVIEPLEDALARLPADDRGRAEAQEGLPDGALTAASHGVSVGKAPETTEGGIVKGTPGFTERPASSITL